MLVRLLVQAGNAWRRLLKSRLALSGLLLVPILLLTVAVWKGLQLRSAPAPPLHPAQPAETGSPPQPRLREVVDSFRRDETIGDALRRHGLSADFSYRLVESARPVYNLARIRAQRSFRLHFTEAGEFRDFIYAVDGDRYLTVYRSGENLVPVMKPFKFETVTEVVSGVIDDSLYNAVNHIGEGYELAGDLADIFMWDIDFYTDIRKNDSFRLLVEKLHLDGSFRRYGAILAAEISVQGKTFSAYRFEDPSGKPRYYAYTGEALSKSFLKSPLRFTRISSRFSTARRHPILKIVRPHLGVDYAAPRGTPVVAVASGKVAFAGPRGEYGRLVRLRHVRGYETMYAHLSSIEVSVGDQVAQGDLIGRVGSTGLATGPHLDFRVLQRGQFINPRQVVVPPDPPVTEALRPRFEDLRDELRARLEQASYAGIAGSR